MTFLRDLFNKYSYVSMSMDGERIKVDLARPTCLASIVNQSHISPYHSAPPDTSRCAIRDTLIRSDEQLLFLVRYCGDKIITHCDADHMADRNAWPML